MFSIRIFKRLPEACVGEPLVDRSLWTTLERSLRTIWKLHLLVLFDDSELVIWSLRALLKSARQSHFCVQPTHIPHWYHNFTWERTTTPHAEFKGISTPTFQATLLSSNHPPFFPLQLSNPKPHLEFWVWDYLLKHKNKRFITKQPQSYYFWRVCAS